jgi:hypothetical protein
LKMFAVLLKETRPALFFGLLAAGAFVASAIFVMPVLIAYFETGLVERLPTFVFASMLALCGLLFGVAGVILDSVARGRAEMKRMLYLALPNARGDSQIGENINRSRRETDAA